MPVIPAFCNTCGTPFSSGIFVDNVTNLTLSGNQSGPCPKCGGMGSVPDGVFNVLQGTIEILSAPQRTVEQLNRFAEFLRLARENNQSKADIQSFIETELPELSGISGFLPQNQNALYAFIGIILMFLQLVVAMQSNPSQTTNININQVIEQVIIQQGFDLPQNLEDDEADRKIRRNDPCPCGSDKRFKRCCGTISI